jgi:hypothetical protein
MATSTRFAVGVHLLPALAANPGKVLRSEDVADSANTNPVVVRTLFSLMTTAGLTALGSVREAVSNWRGWRTTSLCAMSLLRWRAASSSLSIGRPPSASCSVGAHILPVLREATAPAVEDLQEELSRATIVDFAGAVLARSKDAQGAERYRLKQRAELSKIA